MEEIKTARWVVISEHFGKHPHSSRTEEWIRISPPAKAWRHEFISNGTGWSYNVMDERGHLHTASSWENCALSPQANPITKEDLLREVMAPPVTGDPPAVVRNAESKTDWRVRLVNEAGRPLLRYDGERVMGSFRVSHTLWAEPESRRLVKRERTETNLETGEKVAHETYDRYEYNDELPPGTFEMPPGKPVEVSKGDELFPEVWTALPPEERQAIQELVNQSDRGWRTGAFGAFARAWRFTRIRRAPTRAQWQARVREQKGRWREWESEVESVRKQPFVAVQVGASTFTWGPEEQETLAVRAALRAVWSDDGSVWSGHTRFYLRRFGDQYRIVHWECPLEEIKAAHDR